MRNFVVCVAVLGLVACSSGGNGDGSSSSSASSTSTGGNGNGNDSGGNGSGGGSGGSTNTGGSGSTGQVAAPTIDSFTATPNALPSQGGDVLLNAVLARAGRAD